MSATYLGDFVEDSALHFMWSTNDALGASITRSGDGTIHVYKDNAGGTEVTTGITNVEDFDSLTGIHSCTIDLSSAAFYAVGANYTVVLKASTIDGQSVNAVLAHFSIENRFNEVDVTKWLGQAPSVNVNGVPRVDVEYYDGSTGTATSGIPHINAIQISGDSTAADNLEAILDGSGISSDVDITMRSLTITSDVGVGVAITGSSEAVTITSASNDGIAISAGAKGIEIVSSQEAIWCNSSGSTCVLFLASSGYGMDIDGTSGGITVNGSAGPGLELAGTTYDLGATTTNSLQVDATKISGDSTAADNLELQYDTTGLTGDTFPATQAAVGRLSSGSAAISTTAESFTKTASEPETNTYTSTAALDGTYHIVEDNVGNNVTDVYYQFDVGGDGVAVEAIWDGYMQSNGDDYTIWAYDWGNTTFTQIGSRSASNGTTQVEDQWQLTTAHTGTGTDLGKVRIRFLSADGTAVATDRLLVSYTVITRTAGYQEGAIWVNDGASNTNVEAYVDGTADNPVSTWAAALSLSSGLGINKFHIAAGTSITLTDTSDNYELYGEAWTLVLGSRQIDNAIFHGAHVTGAGTTSAAANIAHFEHCHIGAVTLDPSLFDHCGIGESDGQFTAGDDGEYIFADCYSIVAGSGTPDFVFTGLGAATGINNRRWSGGAAYTLDSDCTLSHEVVVGGGTTVTTGGADVEIRGICRAVTLTLSNAGTVQLVGVTGPITISGTATTTVNLYGVATTLTDTSSGTTVNNFTVSDVQLDNIETDTQDLQTQIGTAGTGLTDLGGMSTAMKAEVQVEANDALVANNLDHLLAVATASSDMTTEVVDQSVMSYLLANGDTSVFDGSTDALSNQQANIGTTGTELTGTPSTAPDIATMVLFIYMRLRNEKSMSSSLTTISNDAGTVISQAVISDVADVTTVAEFADP